MEVSVYALDLCVILVHTLDQNRDGVIQLCADVMAAMTGNNFKSAVAAGAAEDGFTDTVVFDGLKQVFIVLCLTVHRKGVIQKVLQICWMNGHTVNFSLVRDGQLEKISFGRGVQPILKHLGHSRAFRPICGTGSRHSILWLFRRFLRHRRLGRFSRLFHFVRLGGSAQSRSGLTILDRLIVLGRFGRLFHFVRFDGSDRSHGRLTILGRLIVLGGFGRLLHFVRLGGSDRSRNGLAILDCLIILGSFSRLLHLVSFGGSNRSHSGLAILDRLIVFGRFSGLLHFVRLGGSDRSHSGLAILDRLIVLGGFGGLLRLVRFGGSDRGRSELFILGRLIVLGRFSRLLYFTGLDSGGR